MDAHALLSYARRQIAEVPDECPISTDDFNAALIYLAALVVEAEIAENETDRALATATPDRRAEMAQRFRRSRGLEGRHG